jgi:hypothetical protein
MNPSNTLVNIFPFSLSQRGHEHLQYIVKKYSLNTTTTGHGLPTSVSC